MNHLALSRLKSGQEYCSNPYIHEVEWICEDYLVKLQAASQHPKASQKLKDIAAQLSAFKLQSGSDIPMAHTPETLLKLDGAIRKLEHTYAYHAQNSPKFKISYSDFIAQETPKHSAIHAPKKHQQWIFIPTMMDATWTENPAKAAMLPFVDWQQFVDDFAAKHDIVKKLSSIEKEVIQLGFSFTPGELPRIKKLTPSFQKIVNGEVEVFDASSDYLSKTCLAVYVNRDQGSDSGFLSEKKTPGADLSNAKLFASEKEAKKFMGSQTDYALVEVEVNLKSFKVVGRPSTADLEAAMSRRESLEIEEALKEASLEQLKAAVKALQDKLDPGSPEAQLFAETKPSRKVKRV